MSNTPDELDYDNASNGLNASTGDYFFEPQTIEEIAARARDDYDQYLSQKPDSKPVKAHLERDHVDELRHLEENKVEHLGPVPWAKPEHLHETGWGVIFPAGDDRKIKDIRDALSELLDHRREQAGKNEPKYYREFIGNDGYRPGDTKIDFLQRYNASFSAADPENVPYYLLIVGDPETIPFSFQYQLDVQYAVGRIYFETLEEYAQYARSVVMSEKSQIKLPRRLTLFGPKNTDDGATKNSATLLIDPLSSEMPKLLSSQKPRWEVQTFLEQTASKEQLLRLMGGDETPALLFTASHGAGFVNGDSRQFAHQGALVCQDWPGPKEWGRKPIRQEFYLAADDITDDARPLGMVAFHFACFGAGTPQQDDFSHTTSKPIAPHAFLARLPQRLLGHPKGGALAVVGHVERAWDYSFKFSKDKKQTETFKSTLYQLMTNYPIGAAMELINERYAEISSWITNYQHQIKQGLTPDNYQLASMWMNNNDARSYVIIGDPAVRVVPGDQASEHRTIEPIILTTPKASPRPAPRPAPPATPGPARSATAATEAEGGDEAAQFGSFFSSGKEIKERLQETLTELADKTKKTLTNALSDVSSLEVLTYVSDDMDQVTYEGGKFAGDAQLRAVTLIKADGDTAVCVPRSGGRMDAELWQVHKDMVAQALTHRAEMIKTLSTALVGLLDALKVL